MTGTLIALISAVFMTAKDTVSKKLSPLVDSTVSTFASFAFAIPFYLVFMGGLALCGVSVFETQKGFFVFIVLRALSDSLAEWCKMRALQLGDLSLVVSLLALYPAILLFASPLVTHDVIPNQAIIGTIMTVIGTLVILFRPRGSTGFPMKAVGFGLASAVFMSINTCFDRMAAQTGTPIFSGFLMTLLAGVFVTPAMLRVKGWQGELAREWRLFSLRGFFELCFMTLKLYALTFLTAPFVVAVQRVSLLFSVVSGRLVFKEQHFLQRLVGSALVAGGIVLVVLS